MSDKMADKSLKTVKAENETGKDVSWKQGFKASVALGALFAALSIFVVLYAGSIGSVLCLEFGQYFCLLSLVISLAYSTFLYGVIGAIFAKLQKELAIPNQQLKAFLYFVFIMGLCELGFRAIGISSISQAYDSVEISIGMFFGKAFLWAILFWPLEQVFKEKTSKKNKSYAIDNVASVKRRVAAFAIDYVVLFLALIFLLLPIMALRFGLTAEPSFEEACFALTPYVILAELVIGAIYWTLFEGVLGYTIGKKLLNLEVIGNDKQKPSLLEAAVRNYPKWAFFIIGSLILLALDSFGFTRTKRKQRFFDQLTDTYVVKVKTK